MGIIVNTTPAEAGWEGHLTLEFSNSSGEIAEFMLTRVSANYSFLKVILALQLTKTGEANIKINQKK